LRCIAFTEYPVSLCASGSKTYRAEATMIAASVVDVLRSRGRQGVPMPGGSWRSLSADIDL
jgi:hypothetical protein